MSEQTSDNQNPQKAKTPFGDVSNKSLERVVTGVKALDVENEAAAKPTNITPPNPDDNNNIDRDRVRALHHLTIGGVDVVPGTEFDVHPRIATTLVAAAHAVRV